MELKWQGAPDSEYSPPFLQGMLDRMIVSYHKYGLVSGARASGQDFLASLYKRIEKYQETGNTEWLIDVANFAMMEFMYPAHGDAHFRPTDSAESPGRARQDGTFTSVPNRDINGKPVLATRPKRDGD